ncbi:MAG: hypothetical protein VX877_02940, partial [Planctomycetota bacterium]|nr:hypothetical protein [Planctomycetota bacterium]
ISWAVNKVKERAAGGAVGLAGGDEGGRVQAEIDRFLNEVRGGGQPSEEAAEAPARGGTGSPPRKPEPTSRRKSLSDRHVIGNRHIDTNVNEHVVEHLPEAKLDEIVNRDLGGNDARDLVSNSAFSDDLSQQEGIPLRTDLQDVMTADNLKELLSQPDGIRQAVLVQEILSRPKGRRGRSGI